MDRRYLPPALTIAASVRPAPRSRIASGAAQPGVVNPAIPYWPPRRHLGRIGRSVRGRPAFADVTFTIAAIDGIFHGARCHPACLARDKRIPPARSPDAHRAHLTWSVRTPLPCWLNAAAGDCPVHLDGVPGTALIALHDGFRALGDIGLLRGAFAANVGIARPGSPATASPAVFRAHR